jgi:drug/metabolite transporter (DMT)-like permease
LIAGSAALAALGLCLQMTASEMTLAAYVSAAKRTSAVFSVLIGGLAFRERGMRWRLGGALVMCAGIALIVIGG